VIACPKCRTIQPTAHINTGDLHSCPGCRELVRTDVFNAFVRPSDQGAVTSGNAVDGEAECFYHAGKPAVAACDACGRLLCSVCRVEFNHRSLCMQCLHAGQDKNKLPELQQQRLLNDSIALHLALWPMLMIFPTVLTAPAAIFFVYRHWRQPAGVLPRGVFKSILALLLAVGQIAGWVVFLIYQFR
jgi:hypothetical protein